MINPLARRNRKGRGLFAKRYSKPGTSPGSFASIDFRTGSKATIDVISYDADSVDELKNVSAKDALATIKPGRVAWINVSGLGDAATLSELGEGLGIHALALEDVFNIPQRPKLEEYEHTTFIVLQMASLEDELQTEQLSLFLTDHAVLSVQIQPGDPFDPVRERIRAGSNIRNHGTDYLMYALMDAVVDNYFPLLEKVGERLETVEDRLLDSLSDDVLRSIHSFKRDVLLLRRAVWPLREVVLGLQHLESPVFTKATRVYLRDLNDHVAQILDMVEVFREFVADLRDLYLSTASQRLNEIMKVLTLISTLFIPLTFIAGIYGMNFINMPELHWYWGYPTALGAMALVAAGMFWFFRKKKWL